MPNKLPTKLKKEPLLDAVFEIRFSTQVPASSVLPGILFNKLDGKKILEQLPPTQLPKQMRDADPNLRFAPLIRIQWKEYLLLIGDWNVAVGCKMPYPGWTNFKNAIIQVANILKEVGIIEGIQRYSLKYVDLIPFADLQKQVSSVRLRLNIGDHILSKEVFLLRIEIPQDDFINVVQLVSSALVTAQDKTTKQGLVVDIDTIRDVGNQQFNDLISGLGNNLDIIHNKNKAIFFDWLEPTYE